MSSGKQNELSSTGQRPRHAGFRVRFAASILDVIAMGAPVYLVVSIFFDFDWLLVGLRGESSGWADLLNTALLTAVTVLLWVNWDGRTPGKKLTHIRIVSYPRYQPFGYGTAVVRTIMGILSALPLLLGYAAISIMIATRPDKRGYHDIVAKTCVIHDE